jgi:hypothetical protein
VVLGHPDLSREPGHGRIRQPQIDGNGDGSTPETGYVPGTESKTQRLRLGCDLRSPVRRQVNQYAAHGLLLQFEILAPVALDRTQRSRAV